MKRLATFAALMLAATALSACDPIAEAYYDRHLESPTNTIAVPPTGYVSSNGRRTYTHPESQTVPAGATQVALTTDGKPGYAVCQHYLTSANNTRDWVLYDDAEVVSTNVIHKYGKALCMEEGFRIKDGHAPQDLHPTAIYVSNSPDQTIGAARAR